MSGTNTGQQGGVGRRTLAKGAAWAVPAIAVAGAAPAHAASGITTTTTTLPPCVAAIGTTGGTYPVSISLSGCNTASSHWDFIFRITAALQSGTACDCAYLRITFFDNPKRTRLWISNNATAENPQSNTLNRPRLYVQKVLAAGNTAAFPADGDAVRRVGGGDPYTSFITTSGTASVGTITAPGTADDSLHTLILPNGSLPCSASGPMAYIEVECGQSQTGPWTPLGGRTEINPCVPMIQASVCRFDTTGNDRYRLGVSVLTSCGIPASSFRVTNIQRNDDTNFPNNGTSVWSGNQALSAGVTNIDMTGTGSGGQLWISFTTDGGANTSRIRVPTNDTTCVGAFAAAESEEGTTEPLTAQSGAETGTSTPPETPESGIPETPESGIPETPESSIPETDASTPPPPTDQ